MNYLEFNFKSKPVFVIEHHAVALKCWIKVIKDKIISPRALLFHIDRHPDFSFQERNLVLSKRLLELPMNELELFIDAYLREDNSEFIVNAIYSGLIDNVITIHHPPISSYYGEEAEGSNQTATYYKFFNGDEIHKNYIEMSTDIASIYGYQCFLGDSVYNRNLNELFSNSQNMILDIDLDFFIYNNGGSYPRHKHDIENQLFSDSFDELITRAKIITIALEPGSMGCGSKENCLEILEGIYQRIPTLDVEKIKSTFFKQNSL